MAEDSALVLVSPGDTIDAIVQKVRAAGAASVELLVPEGTAALQALSGFARLRQALERDRVGLLVISSDEKTLNAARLNQLDTVGVQGAKVTFPAAPAGAATSPYATQVLPRDEGVRPAAIAEEDAEFLSALDQVAAHDRYAGLSDEDAELFASLDDLSDAIQSSAAAGRRERAAAGDELGSALDEWAATTDEAQGEDWEAAFGDRGATPRRRVRAEDLELSEDELRRQRGGRRTEALRERARAASTTLAGARPAWRRRGALRDRLLDLEEAEEAAPRRRPSLLLIVLVVLLLLALAALFWYRSASAAVTIAPPPASVNEHPFDDEVIPLATGATDQNAAAVQALPVSAEASYSAQGQVLSETLSPAGRAHGVITIINTIEQPIQLPAGTEFIATNPQGQEVRFMLDVDATVPPAVTTRSLTGVSTTYGTIDVAITARSPGSASNVGENSIKQMLIPGQQPINSDSSILIRHGPIGGGSEELQRIVTKDDVQRVLGEALTGLYNAGVQALRSQIDEARQGIDLASLHPNPEELGSPENYEPPIVEPPEGQPVDPNNPTFTVTVKATFHALATPRDRPVSDQLQTVVPQHFSQSGTLPCRPGEQPAFNVSNWNWDGARLTIDGAITCTPRQGIAPETLARVREAIRGRSRAEAAARLDELQRQGLIGGYQLPDKDRLPGLDLLLTVNVERSVASPAPSPQPTQEAAP